jgi:hypothetical protein
MNNLQFFVTALVIMSAVVGLATEAVKMILDERNIKYYANTLAGIVSLVMSFAAGIAYVVLTGTAFTGPTIVGIIMFVFMSWLCAMVGYDKVIQTIAQFKKESDEN